MSHRRGTARAEERGVRPRLAIAAILAANATSLLGNVFAALAIPWFVLVETGSALQTAWPLRTFLPVDVRYSGHHGGMTEQRRTNTPPIILVPGFWLGAWAWDEVADALRADGHDVTAITLPGLESKDADRSTITFDDHVDAIVQAVEASGVPVVLVLHSAAGFTGYAASDRIPQKIAAMVYVDTAPGIGPLDPDFADAEKPMVWAEIEAEENLDGLSEEQKETFRRRAVPQPGGVLRGSAELTNDARRDIPSTVICTGFSAEQYQTYAREHPDWAFLAGIPELRNVSWVDLPTSHWPMWSRADELARLIGEAATTPASTVT